MTRTALLAALVVALAVCGASASAPNDYQLRDLHGKLHRASQHFGKRLIINFRATWCPPCVHEMPELEKFYRDNRQRAQVRGVTFEDTDRDKLIEFVERRGIGYPILGHGQNPNTGYRRVKVLPTAFVICKQGLFRRRFEGSRPGTCSA